MKEQTNQKRDSLPRIEELQEWYEEEQRQEANFAIQQEEQNQMGEQGAFFHRFRKENQENATLLKRENPAYLSYRNYRKKEMAKQGERIEEIENRILYETFFLRWERKVGRGSTAGTRYRVDAIKELERQKEKMIQESYEAWEFYYTRQFALDIEAQKEQRLVPVPYVQQAKERVLHSLNLGVPVYIAGHLGSGKTQLALEAATDFAVQNKMQEALEHQMETWFSTSPEATEEDAVKAFCSFYQQQHAYYKNVFLQGKPEEIEALQPLFISGSYNLTYEDMFVEKTLTLGQSFSQNSYAEYLDMLLEEFSGWLQDNRSSLEKMTEQEQFQVKIQAWKTLSDLFVASNSAFGTEIRKTEKEILIAVKEGRPVIVDELNTIAMQNLIGLNDILQRHAGDTAYITGVGPVYIHPGFAFIGTGNLSTKRVTYEGTNELNPAFKSRFVTIEYNYVPQTLVGSLEEQESPEKNELFRIILARLARDNGSIQLPKGKRNLEELFRFAQLSKVTQNVFMGKWKDDPSEEAFEGEELELQEAVLSIRNILHVLDNWNQGEEKDLSKALWDGFISSITAPDDQNYILSQAVRFGFFPEEDGWKIATKGVGEATTTYEEIRTRPYEYIRLGTDTFSSLDLVHLLFGKAKTPTVISKELQEILQMEDPILPMKLEEYQQLDEAVSHLEHSSEVLEYIKKRGEQHED